MSEINFKNSLGKLFQTFVVTNGDATNVENDLKNGKKYPEHAIIFAPLSSDAPKTNYKMFITDDSGQLHKVTDANFIANQSDTNEAVSTKISELETKDQVLLTQISELTEINSSLVNRLNELENSSSTLFTDVNNLNASDNSLENRIANLEASATSMSATDNNVAAKITQLENTIALLKIALNNVDNLTIKDATGQANKTTVNDFVNNTTVINASELNEETENNSIINQSTNVIIVDNSNSTNSTSEEQLNEIDAIFHQSINIKDIRNTVLNNTTIVVQDMHLDESTAYEEDGTLYGDEFHTCNSENVTQLWCGQVHKWPIAQIACAFRKGNLIVEKEDYLYIRVWMGGQIECESKTNFNYNKAIRLHTGYNNVLYDGGDWVIFHKYYDYSNDCCILYDLTNGDDNKTYVPLIPGKDPNNIDEIYADHLDNESRYHNGTPFVRELYTTFDETFTDYKNVTSTAQLYNNDGMLNNQTGVPIEYKYFRTKYKLKPGTYCFDTFAPINYYDILTQSTNHV